MPNLPTIDVKNLSKNFKLPRERYSSVKQAVLNWRRRSYQNLPVLKNVNFNIKKGEFFGIVGRNGSGKSTLLKILARIYEPTAGSVTINGSLTPFIELGVGFNAELSGRDNIFLNGAILGLRRKEIEAKYNEIVAFAELEQFMDQKLKNYSSGMQVRLAFSVAIHTHLDILLVDEVLAVGDLNFQRKCFDHFHKLKRAGKTVILVTHDMRAIQEFCNRGIVLERGRVIKEGKPDAIVRKYHDINEQSERLSVSDGISKKSARLVAEARIDRLEARNRKGQKQALFNPKDKLRFIVEFKVLKDLDNPFVGLAITNIEGRVVFASSTKEQGLVLGKLKKGEKYRAAFDIDNVYTDGTYIVSTALDSQDGRISHARLDGGLEIRTRGFNLSHSLVHPGHTITINKLV